MSTEAIKVQLTNALVLILKMSVTANLYDARRTSIDSSVINVNTTSTCVCILRCGCSVSIAHLIGGECSMLIGQFHLTKQARNGG